MSKFGASIAFVGLLLMASGCAQVMEAVGKPKVVSVSPRVTGIDLENVTLAFDVKVENPYPFPLASPRFKYGVEIEEKDLFTSEDAVAVDVPASSTGAVVLPVKLTYAKVWATCKGLVNAKEVAYKLHGALIVSAMGQSYELPVSHSGTFPVLRPPKFSNTTAKFSDVSLTSATVTVEADLVNPNVFDLNAKDLGYQLRLGEVQVGNLSASTTGKIGPGQSGHVTLTGKITASNALVSIVRKRSVGSVTVSATGELETPYGPVKLGK